MRLEGWNWPLHRASAVKAIKARSSRTLRASSKLGLEKLDLNQIKSPNGLYLVVELLDQVTEQLDLVAVQLDRVTKQPDLIKARRIRANLSKLSHDPSSRGCSKGHVRESKDLLCQRRKEKSAEEGGRGRLPADREEKGDGQAI